MPSATTELPHPYNKIGDGPEGPEVATVADALQRFVGRSVVSAVCTAAAKTVGWEQLTFPTTITGVSTRGKKLLLRTTDYTLVVSLGMTGRLQYHMGNNSHVHLQLDNELALYYEDPRRFGDITVVSNAALNTYLQRLGPDVLAAARATWISSEQWRTIFANPRRKRRNICAALLDQEMVAGIGNYLKSEILYYSSISPHRTLGSLSEEEVEQLRQVAHQVILISYSYGGLTIESFISPEGTPGTYPAAVYGQKEDKQGYAVMMEKIGGRATYWVPVVQK